MAVVAFDAERVDMAYMAADAMEFVPSNRAQVHALPHRLDARRRGHRPHRGRRGRAKNWAAAGPVPERCARGRCARRRYRRPSRAERAQHFLEDSASPRRAAPLEGWTAERVQRLEVQLPAEEYKLKREEHNWIAAWQARKPETRIVSPAEDADLRLCLPPSALSVGGSALDTAPLGEQNELRPSNVTTGAAIGSVLVTLKVDGVEVSVLRAATRAARPRQHRRRAPTCRTFGRRRWWWRSRPQGLPGPAPRRRPKARRCA